MVSWLEQLKARPWVAHLIRTQERFSSRLGSQFAAAISYFSVLSMVPILMFAFSMLGMTLTVLRPDWLSQVHELIASQFTNADLGPQIVTVVDDALNNWTTIGIIGVLAAAWSGIGWVANLKAAVRGQWRRDFDLAERKGSFVTETAQNLGILVALFVGVSASFAASTIATTAAELIFGTLGLAQVPGGGFLLRSVPVIVSLATGFLLFWFLYTVLPESKVERTALWKGSLAGAVGLAILEYSAGLLFGAFSGNAAAAIFGPVIVLMLFFNLFATLILLVAAWIATSSLPAEPAPAVDPAPLLEPPAPEMVSQAVAKRALGIGLGTGYAVGAATGLGIGAVVASALHRLASLGRRR